MQRMTPEHELPPHPQNSGAHFTPWSALHHQGPHLFGPHFTLRRSVVVAVVGPHFGDGPP